MERLDSDNGKRPFIQLWIEWSLIVLVIGTLIGFSLKIMF